MVRGEVRDICRRALENADPRISQKVNDAELNSIINQGLIEFARAMEGGDETGAALVHAADGYAVPADFLVMRRVETPDNLPCTLAIMGQIQDLDAAADEVNTAGKFFYWRGTRKLEYWPKSASDTMQIYYLSIPERFNLSNRVHNKATSTVSLDDDDELTLPISQHQAVVDWSLWHAFQRVGLDGNDYKRQFAFAKREQHDKDKDPQVYRTGTSQRGLSFGTKKGI
jgi:hypothetical protein